MRTTILLLSIAVLPLVAGCTNANSAPEPTNVATPAKLEVAPPVETPEGGALAGAEIPAGRVVSTNFTLPDAVKLSPAATEIAKMARAGVDPSVMATYVVNSVNTYNLSADEIVYLNDLGLHPDVVSAMIQHDQQIREASLNGAMAASPATPAPSASVWDSSTATQAANVWQETAAAPAPTAEVQTTVPPPPAEERPAEVTVNYFYDSLAPYGMWIDIDGYGRCWRPTVAVTYAGWRPYVQGGRWLWTDCGWYWYSDYSWGWAPFHYGRWFSHPHWGWCWVPGTVWGPSWVSWRYTDGYCGWAPLPPAAYYAPGFGFSYYGRSCGVGFSFGLTWDCFTFVSYNHFHRRHYDRHRVGHHESAQIFNNSTVINNVIVGDNNTIINQGISPDRISAVTRTEIPRTQVNALAGGPRGGGRHETLAANGQTLTVARHEVPGGRPPVREGTVQAPALNPAALVAPTAATLDASATRTGTTRTGPGSGPSRNGAPTASTHTESPVATSVNASSPITQSAGPARGDRPRTGGALIIREGRVASTPSAANTQSDSSPTASPSATPWLNNSASTASAPTRTPRSTWQSPGRSDRYPAGPAATPTSPTPPTRASQPAPPPAVIAPQAPSVTSPATGPTRPEVVRSQRSPWQSSSRSESVNNPPRHPGINNANTIRSAPTYSAPTVRQPTPAPAPSTPRVSPPASAPRVERSSPSRTFDVPSRAQPSRSYSPPTPAPSRPAAPAHQSAPQRSAPSASGGDRDSGSRASRPGR